MTEDRWYKNAVIYSLEVETFLDGIAGREGPLAARSTLPTTSQLVYSICATEVA